MRTLQKGGNHRQETRLELRTSGVPGSTALFLMEVEDFTKRNKGKQKHNTHRMQMQETMWKQQQEHCNVHGHHRTTHVYPTSSVEITTTTKSSCENQFLLLLEKSRIQRAAHEHPTVPYPLSLSLSLKSATRVQLQSLRPSNTPDGQTIT
jgi:ribonucleotide reductase alpha subunit